MIVMTDSRVFENALRVFETTFPAKQLIWLGMMVRLI
jgi:hypothetical protein